MIDPVDTGVQKYLAVIAAYDAEFKAWERRATKIVRRYRDDNRNQSGSDSSARFNVLWSNVQTLVPAVIPNSRRRTYRAGMATTTRWGGWRRC